MISFFKFFGLSPEHAAALEEYAESEGVTVARLVVDILAQWLRLHPVTADGSSLHPSTDGLRMASPNE